MTTIPKTQLGEAREMLEYYVNELRQAKAQRDVLLAMCQNALEALSGLAESNVCMSDFERACIPALRHAIALTQKEEA